MTSDLQAQMLQILAARHGLPAGSNPQEVLAHLAQGDPTTALFANYLSQRQAETGDQSEVEEAQLKDDESPDGPVPEPASAEAWKQRARAKIRMLMTEIEQLRECNDTLAAALGACYLCWGTDPACQHCHGRGSAGASLPDEELFEQIIAPAVRRLQRAGYRSTFAEKLARTHTARDPRSESNGAQTGP